MPHITCQRCGTCCQKGGPGLHLEDIRLIKMKVLSPDTLICFRKGEFAFDQARQCLAPLTQELIKIRGKEKGWECLFYDPSTRGCGMYENRPLECRTLMCWETKGIEELITSNDRLNRFHLVPEDSGLAALIKEHESHCALEHVARILRPGGAEKPGVRQEILDMCSYDMSFREALKQRAGIDDHVLECYFGRPLFRAVLGYDDWLGSEDFLRYFL